MKMTDSQRKAMIEFHRKAEAAYRKHGKPEQAEMAKRQREKLERADECEPT